MQKIFFGLFLMILIGFGFSHLAHAEIFTVTTTSDDDCSDFNCDLQAAFDEADSNFEGDVINIAAGEYFIPSGGWNYFTLQNDPLTLRGAGMGRTILNGTPPGPGTDPDQVMRLGVGNTLSSPDERNASITVVGISFRNGVSSFGGGGLFVSTYSDNVTVSQCSFENNQVDSVSNGGGGLGVSTLTEGDVFVTDNLFVGNTSFNQNGGGLNITATSFNSMVVARNVFIDNVAGEPGSAPDEFISGGGAYLYNDGSTGFFDVRENLVLGNYTEAMGAGLFVSCRFVDCRLANNIVAANVAGGFMAPGQIVRGGGISVLSDTRDITIVHNTITGNEIAGNGGGLGVWVSLSTTDSSDLDMDNNIVWGNTAIGQDLCGGGSCHDVFILDGQGDMVYLRNNNFGDFYFSCRDDSCPNRFDLNNQSVNPQFVNALGDNYHLLSSSSLIDSGNASPPFLPDFDYDGASRFIGNNPDIGAYEWDSAGLPPESNCFNTLDDDEDGAVDCEDSDCANNFACGGSVDFEICDNNLDDDNNGLLDCADSECEGASICQADEDEGDVGFCPGLNLQECILTQFLGLGNCALHPDANPHSKNVFPVAAIMALFTFWGFVRVYAAKRPGEGLSKNPES